MIAPNMRSADLWPLLTARHAKFLHTMRDRLHFDACVLQSSTVGRRLYEQMGFREVTRFSVFRSVPDQMRR